MNISPIFYPTKTIFLDDDELFLKALALEFGQTHCNYTSSPKEALDMIKNHSQSPLEGVIEHHKQGIVDHTSYGLNFKNIYSQAMNNPITTSVLVVDHHMPEMSGIDFCLQLNDLPIKKIMLTGVGSLETAVDALNHGTIDYFIQKGQPDISTKLHKAIEAMKNDFFRQGSEKILSHLNPIIQASNEYQKKWNELLEKTQAVEYCILDENGSYLFIDSGGQKHWLLIKTESEINELAEIAEGFDASVELIEKLQGHEIFPYFLNEENQNKTIENWGSISHKCRILCDGVFYSTHTGELN